ncbi:CBS domain-containing protein [Streptomyces beihaiensis]|uniref:CBS domain-containing protein n=1 Tax=Streptomyces beihaiensis TaxID=2984495 RepID=A0ABT3TXF4_9ACTN|nr:CBS domain-containing protein [Streptomyces beihaiensis]MCX3061728.1 CBS domain-containing protein [Streptomyces beihaiensis]
MNTYESRGPGGEGVRQEALVRYLGAVTAAAARHTALGEPHAHTSADGGRHPAPPEVTGSSTEPARVRDVMDVPAASLREDMTYREIARHLARERAGALPVVDATDHVLGVVSESDLLAKVAHEASGHRPGRVGRSWERRLGSKSHGETAADLMTSPAITVSPGATVAEAAWLAALSRLKRVPVTDHEGRLVGVVRRDALLQTLIRDDSLIRDEVDTRISAICPPAEREAVEVNVHDGVVELAGRVSPATGTRLVASVEEIADVVAVKNLFTSG